MLFCASSGEIQGESGNDLKLSHSLKVTWMLALVAETNRLTQHSLGFQLQKELSIPASTLELGEPIGQGKHFTNSKYDEYQSMMNIFFFITGEFGIVYKAHLMKDFGQRVTNTVAVKTLKGKSSSHFAI